MAAFRVMLERRTSAQTCGKVGPSLEATKPNVKARNGSGYIWGNCCDATAMVNLSSKSHFKSMIADVRRCGTRSAPPNVGNPVR